MPRIIERTLTIVRSILPDKRVVSYLLLLLALHIIGMRAPHFTEFDIITHFFFGFIISEYVSKCTSNIGLHETFADKLHDGKWFTMSPHRVDLLFRVFGFLLIGGLFWESAEFFLGPFFRLRPDPFFTLPINPYNIDGFIDVTVGMLGTLVAWYKRAHSCRIPVVIVATVHTPFFSSLNNARNMIRNPKEICAS